MPSLPSQPTEVQDSGFISRWSRRKALVRQGAAVAEVASVASAASEAAPTVVAPVVESAPALPLVTLEPPAPVAATPDEPPAPPPLTMTDVAALTRDSDYSRFMARGVQPDVKNAALGKLFTDPHFNVMDGLDTYIDDYGKPDPLPEGMLRQMLQAHVLGLFDHEKTDEDNKTEPSTDAQPACAVAPTPEPVTDENTDLQLQPDDDAGRPGAATSTEQDAGCAH